MDNGPDEKLSIETPEQVAIEFSLAGIGSRFLALAIDTLLMMLALAALGSVLFLVRYYTGGAGAWPKTWLAALIVAMAFITFVGYFAIFEAIWNGQTPGKRLERIRVIMESGRPITTFASATRNFLRIIDSLPVLYVVGIVSAIVSSQNRRLGDFVAGTVVVHERLLEKEPQKAVGAPPPNDGSPVLAHVDARGLSPEDFRLIDAFLARSTELPRHIRLQMARRILDRVAPTLQIVSSQIREPESALRQIARSYLNRASIL
ncbi:MAG: RDD family protein [Terriglobia bacterium]